MRPNHTYFCSALISTTTSYQIILEKDVPEYVYKSVAFVGSASASKHTINVKVEATFAPGEEVCPIDNFDIIAGTYTTVKYYNAAYYSLVISVKHTVTGSSIPILQVFMMCL